MATRLPDIEEWIKSVERSSPDDPRESDWGLISNPNAMATTEPQATQHDTPSLFSALPPPQRHSLTPSTTTQPHPTARRHTSAPLTEKRSEDQLRTTAHLIVIESPTNLSRNDPGIDIGHAGVLVEQSIQKQLQPDIEEKAVEPKRQLRSPMPSPTVDPSQPTFEPSPGSKRKMLKSSTFSISRPNLQVEDMKLLRTSSFPLPKSAPTSPVFRKTERGAESSSSQVARVRKKSLSHGNLEKYSEETELACGVSSLSSGSMDSMRRNTPSSQRSGERSLSQNSQDIEAVLARLESPSAMLGGAVTGAGERAYERAEERSPNRSPLVRQRHTSHSPSPSPPPSYIPPSTSPPSSPHTLSPNHRPLSQHQLQRHEKLQGKGFTFDTTNDDTLYRSGTQQQQRFLARRSIPSPPCTSPPASHPHKPHTVSHHPHSVSDYSSSHSSSMSHDSSGKGSYVVGRRSSSPVYSPSHYRSQSLGKYHHALVTVKESHEKLSGELSIDSVCSTQGGARSGSITQMILEHKQRKEQEKSSLLAAAAECDKPGGSGDTRQVNRQDSGIGTISSASVKYSL